ncbi:MAG: peptidoglycan DD-metalloendopeptidase family protein [Sterolibacterium sp.]|nr:peptidoglycan DD-metalloendopeptidase family protein [Sterolibacterium sp.]
MPTAAAAPSSRHAASAEKPAAQAASPVATRRDELKELRERLGKLNQDAAQTEATRASTQDQLKTTEMAITDANRRLASLGQQREATETALDALQRQSQRLARQITTQQGQLSQLLYRQYANGEVDALRLLLSGGNANQAARDLHYMTLLSRAKADLLGTLRLSLSEKQQLGEAVAVKREELSTIETSQQQQRTLLLEQQQQRQTMLARLGDKLKAQRHEIDRLKQDEKRLGQLIDQITRLAARQAARQAALQAQARAAARKKQAARNTPLKSAPSLATRPGTPREAPVTSEPLARNDQEPRDLNGDDRNNDDGNDDNNSNGYFAARKGRLHLPVRGEILHRFGTARAEGSNWKGLFIRTTAGAEVKAPAPGRVVFADWLRGFGNLLIIDHGDGWLTVYGHNQSLRRHVGDMIKTGETIASAGSRDDNPETGLYFELRQQGRVIDPLKWFSLK